MKIKPYIERLNNSKEYKKFQKKYSDAFMMAGFFILDFESGKNSHQIDYYVPSEKKVAAFSLDKGVSLQMLDTAKMGAKAPEQLDIQANIDLDALHGILEDEMKNRSITDEIKKIIAIVQTVDGKKIWNLNCVLSGMGILKAHVDDDSQTVLKMEKISLSDIMKKITPEQLAALQRGKVQPGEPQKEEKEESEEVGEESQEEPKETNLDAEEKLKKLNQLEEAIEKEKALIQREAGEKKPAKKASKKSKEKA
jgi:hypothetical protein